MTLLKKKIQEKNISKDKSITHKALGRGVICLHYGYSLACFIPFFLLGNYNAKL